MVISQVNSRFIVQSLILFLSDLRLILFTRSQYTYGFPWYAFSISIELALRQSSLAFENIPASPCQMNFPIVQNEEIILFDCLSCTDDRPAQTNGVPNRNKWSKWNLLKILQERRARNVQNERFPV